MKIQYTVLIVSFALALAGCRPSVAPPGDLPVSSDDTPMPAEPPVSGQVETGQAAMVESLDALILESWPLQVHAVIRGNLPDGCTTVRRIESRQEANRFIITIFTQRDKEAFCTLALVPFEKTHPLNVYGLPEGTYTIDAYGVTAEFTFDQPNAIQNPGGG